VAGYGAKKSFRRDFGYSSMKKSAGRGVVLTMGTFDGVHRGHQSILRRAVQRAKILGVRSLAMTFVRPPRLYFSPQPGPQILTTQTEKKELLKSFGVDDARVYHFNGSIARLSANDFFNKYILKRFKAQAIVVGYNFAFGRGREGNTRFLKQIGKRNGLRVHVMPPFRLNGHNVSSGKIRRDILLGKVGEANQKLGYRYLATGRVIKGRGLGRGIGYPTANLAVSREKILPLGVFAVHVILPNGKVYGGMCNIGFHPTVGRSKALSVEAHLFNFRGNLRGMNLRVHFLKRLRPERKFASIEALTSQLQKDESTAKQCLRSRSSTH
jgi:riboflavin kinase/FMN adenylyltransferase